MVDSKHAETAGTMMAFLLAIGLGSGAALSFVITKTVWDQGGKSLFCCRSYSLNAGLLTKAVKIIVHHSREKTMRSKDNLKMTHCFENIDS